MLKIFFIVFSQICIGGVALLPLVPSKEIGEGFFKFMGGLYLVLMGLALAAGLSSWDFHLWDFYYSWGGWELVLSVVFTAFLAAYNLSLWFRLSALKGGLLGASVVLGGAAIVSSSMAYVTQNMPFGVALLPLNFIASTLLLGSATTGMLLGHWYLVSPSLSVAPLRRITLVLLVSLVAAGSLLALNLGLVGSQPLSDGGPSLLEALVGIAGYGMFFWLRALVGLLFPLVIAAMVLQTLKIKATQAATGLLYLAMVAAFAGEMLGRYLLLATSVPL
jgi:hypothetical protein